MKNLLSRKKTKNVAQDAVDALDGAAATQDTPMNGDKKGKKKSKSSISPSMKKTLLAVGAAAFLAISGVLMLVSYVKSAEESAVAVEEVPTQTVVVAKAPIPGGTTLNSLQAENWNRFAEEPVPVSLVPEGALLSIEQLASMGDLMTEVNLSVGETVLANRFVPTQQFAIRDARGEVPADHHQISFRVPHHRILNGQVRSNSQISISATFGARDGFPALSAVILTAVEVVDVKFEGALPVQAPQPETDDETVMFSEPSTDTLESALTGTYIVTVAVTAEELTKLHYTIDNGNIMVAAATENPETDLKSVSTIVDILGDAGAVIDPDTGEFEIQRFAPGLGAGDAGATVAFADGEAPVADATSDNSLADGTQSPADAFGSDEG